MKKNVHIITHSHWDREWYMSFEYHRARLVELIDTCIWLIENDSEFGSFHLDGHTIGLEDYLEIKPYNREKLKKYVSEGRIHVGPWYVLQDEFLTSSEANIRNLLVGMDMAEEFGKLCKVGYFPDSFGNVSQMPQILSQAGMDAIAFGRGVKPTGVNNEISDSDSYESQYSEMYWQSPDGTKMPAILFANWYNIGQEMPSDGDKNYWDEKLSAVEKYAATDELLMMNGSDHMPIQPDVTAAINAARKNYPDYNFIHSNFADYAKTVVPKLKDDIAVVKGELTSQNGNGWWTLVNTCSSHVNLKRMNRLGEIMLESVAEPLSTIAAMLGKEYPRDMILYSWKTLMKNHPHDSICGCSVDEVNDEMRTRFIKSYQAAETVVNRELEYIGKHIDKTGLEDCDAVFAVINTYAKMKNEVVTVTVNVNRTYGKQEEMVAAANEITDREKYTEYVLVDAAGNVIPAKIGKPEPKFGYYLPNDCFRKPYMAEAIAVTFEAEAVPGFGFKTYGLKKSSEAVALKSMITAENTMENEYIKAVINADGTVNLTDKKNGKSFNGLLRFEDISDIGNEYSFLPAKGDEPIYSDNFPTEIELVCDEEYRAEYKIIKRMIVPESCDELLDEEIKKYIHSLYRQSKRSEKMTELVMNSYVSLDKNGKSINVRTEFKNTAKDHRLRVIIPTGLDCSWHRVESVFDSVKRDNRHGPNWTNPSECEHQQGFVTMKDEKSGILVANIGMYEYEILKNNEIAITLVRAVGELGDWGSFPTKLSQCLTDLVCEYRIGVFDDDSEGYDIACEIQHPMQNVQIFETDKADYRPDEFKWSGNCIRMTALKKAEKGDDTIMRWVNYSDEEQVLTIDKTCWIANVYLSNVIEEKGEAVDAVDGKWKFKLRPHEIFTLGAF